MEAEIERQIMYSHCVSAQRIMKETSADSCAHQGEDNIAIRSH